MKRNQVHEWEVIWNDGSHERVKSFAQLCEAVAFKGQLSEYSDLQATVYNVNDMGVEWNREQYTSAIAKLTRKLANAQQLGESEFRACMAEVESLRVERLGVAA